MAIEVAAKQGAKILFMPTWSAENDIERGGMSHHLSHFIDRAESKLKPGKGIRLTDSRGKLTAECRECLDAARQYGMTVCSGHVSPQESIALAEIKSGKSDIEILAWLNANTKRQTFEVVAWSAWLEQHGPGSADGHEWIAGVIKGNKSARDDIRSFAEMLDLDDYISYGGKA